MHFMIKHRTLICLHFGTYNFVLVTSASLWSLKNRNILVSWRPLFSFCFSMKVHGRLLAFRNSDVGEPICFMICSSGSPRVHQQITPRWKPSFGDKAEPKSASSSPAAVYIFHVQQWFQSVFTHMRVPR